jgi:hypothetical protein
MRDNQMKSKKPFIRKLSALCFLIASFYCIPLQAQLSVGIEGGYNKNYLVTNNSNRAFTNYVPMNGFNVGIPVQYQLNDWFALTADPTFIQKNYRQERSSFFTGVYQNNYNSYIQLPLTARVLFGAERLKGFIDGGVYGSYWISSRIKGVNSNILDLPDDNGNSSSVFDFQKPYSYDEKYAFDSKKDNRYEFGWIAGLGVGYDITERYHIFSEARMMYSFTDQQKEYMINQVPRYNTTYGINLGVMYHLQSNRQNNYYSN